MYNILHPELKDRLKLLVQLCFIKRLANVDIDILF